jgi:copper chaperone CopZ
MSILKVVNIKCGGCEAQIINSLEKDGLREIKVDINNQTVSFIGDIETAKERLNILGYPEDGTPEAKKLRNKAKSFLSCFIGRIKR